jgi:hypothetical protein
MVAPWAVQTAGVGETDSLSELDKPSTVDARASEYRPMPMVSLNAFLNSKPMSPASTPASSGWRGLCCGRIDRKGPVECGRPGRRGTREKTPQRRARGADGNGGVRAERRGPSVVTWNAYELPKGSAVRRPGAVLKKEPPEGGPSLGRKRPRSASQQSLAALQHMMSRLVRSRGSVAMTADMVEPAQQGSWEDRAHLEHTIQLGNRTP